MWRKEIFCEMSSGLSLKLTLNWVTFIKSLSKIAHQGKIRQSTEAKIEKNE